MIYLIADKELTVCKIGYSKDVRKRLYELQTASPFKLHLYADRRGDSKLEHKIHKELTPWRMHGEWFTFCPEVVETFNTFEDRPDLPKINGWMTTQIQDVLYEMMVSRDVNNCDYEYWAHTILYVMRDAGHEYARMAEYRLRRHMRDPLKDELLTTVAWKAMLDAALGEDMR